MKAKLNAKCPACAQALPVQSGRKDTVRTVTCESVSYTHLTLPTNSRV